MASICIAGKNRIAVEAMNHLRCEHPGVRICAAVNRTDSGLDAWQPSLKKLAKDGGIRIAELEELQSQPDLIFVSLEYDQLIKPSLFRSSRLYNIHFSLLPEYKGMFTSVWPLLDGKNHSGVSLHEIDAGIDTGALIDQIRFEIGPDITSKDLYETYQRHGFELFKKWLPMILTGPVPSRPQPSSGSSYRSKASIDFSRITIDLKQTAENIHNQIRAYNFRDYQVPVVMGRSIGSSVILPSPSRLKPGTLIREERAFLDIATVDYDIRLSIDPLDELLRCCSSGDEDGALHHAERLQDLEMRNKHGWNAMMIAAFHNHTSLVRCLLDRGADINARNYKGTTVLMFAKGGAVRSGDCSSLSLLLDEGADSSLRDLTGSTVLDYARHEGAHDVVQILETKSTARQPAAA